MPADAAKADIRRVLKSVCGDTKRHVNSCLKKSCKSSLTCIIYKWTSTRLQGLLFSHLDAVYTCLLFTIGSTIRSSRVLLAITAR